MKKLKIIFILALVLGGFSYWLYDGSGTKDEASKFDLIRIQTPKPGETVTSPIRIKGEARGPWFFEASFSVVLTDWDGRIIGEAIATAEDEWMTEDYVPFTAELYFDADPNVYSDKGTLIFHKHNASGLPEHDDALEFDVNVDSSGESSPNIEQEVNLSYEDDATGMHFDYRVSPEGYILEEPSIGSNEDASLVKAVILTRIADHEEMQKDEGGREGPPTINVYIFNSESSGLNEWLEEKRGFTNFNNASKQSFVMGGIEGLRYTWDGLYQGETVAIQRVGKIYMVVGTYLSGIEDGRRTDFQHLINSFGFSN